LYVVERLHEAFMINEEISSKTTNKLFKYISDRGDKDINITIDSDGGDIESALCMYDILRSLPEKQSIFTIVLGKCYSATNIIFCASQENRMAFENSSFMIHNIMTSFELEDVGKIYSAVKHTLSIQERMYDIIGSCMTVNPRTFVKNNDEWYMDGKSASKYKYAKVICQGLEDVKEDNKEIIMAQYPIPRPRNVN